MSLLPQDKVWLFVADLAPYFDVSEDTVSKSMDLPFKRISKKLKAVHIEDLRSWELEKRGITGEFKSNAEARAIPQLSELKPKRNNGKRGSLMNTNVGELEKALNIQSGRR